MGRVLTSKTRAKIEANILKTTFCILSAPLIKVGRKKSFEKSLQVFVLIGTTKLKKKILFSTFHGSQ